MAVTLRQIAELAGVSRGTVDRVINNRGHVNEEVEARVRQIAMELGYEPNPVGQALARGASRRGRGFRGAVMASGCGAGRFRSGARGAGGP